MAGIRVRGYDQGERGSESDTAMSYSRAIGILVAAGVVLCAGVVDGAWFMPLPQLPGATEPGDAYAVSADGMFAVGTSHDGRSTTGATNQAVRWTASGTVQNLNAGDSSIARGVSGDGSVAAGYRIGERGFPIAFRWTQGGGSMDLEDFPGGESFGRAYDVSGDGNVVVGFGVSTQGGEAFRWTSTGGMVGLGDLPGGIFASEAFGVSENGSAIVGSSSSANGSEAFRWTQETGMVGLGDLPGDGFFSEAYDVSADGSVIVGKSAGTSPISFSAFRWTAAEGMIQLPDLPGVGPTTIAQAVSGDGNVVVGAALNGNGQAVAFAWDAYNGSRSVPALLESQGVDLDGFRLGKASGVSFDGLTLVGIGLPRDSLIFQPWIARLDPGTFVPEPSSVCIVGVVGVPVLGWYCWKRVRRRFTA
jgi:probable HAF family extracellular repeat protein